MGRVRYTVQARADLIDLWLYIAADSPEVADNCLDRIEAGCQRLEIFPEAGLARMDIAPDARVLLVERWLVVYRLQ